MPAVSHLDLLGSPGDSVRQVDPEEIAVRDSEVCPEDLSEQVSSDPVWEGQGQGQTSV